MSAQIKTYIPEGLKKSISTYVAILYGIFAMIFMIFIPVIPFKDKSLIWYGLNYGQAEALVVISILFSLIFIVASITLIVKFKRYGNGALYALHKFFGFYAFFYFTLYFISSFMFDSSIVEYYIYSAINYYFIPSIVAVSSVLVFIQVSQCYNKCLHINFIKTGYAILSLLVGVGLSLWIYFVISNNYESYLFMMVSSKAEIIVFYYLMLGITVLFAIKRWLYITLPVNDCFGAMYYNSNDNAFSKTYDSEISYWENFILATVYLISFIYLLVCELRAMPIALGIGIFFIIGLTIWAMLYNAHIRKVKFAEREKIREEKAAASVAATADAQNADSDSEKPSVKVEHLRDKNDKVKDCTVKPNAFVSGFSQKLLRNRLYMSADDVKKLFTAMASSRVVFVKGISDAMTLEFMEAIAGAFETEVYIDKYYQMLNGEPQEDTPEFDYAKDVNRKKGVANGVYAANYLTHFIQPVFFKSTVDNFSEYRLRLLKAIVKGELFYTGSQEELTKNDVYYGGNINVTDNLWAIVLADDDAISVVKDPDILKHSSIIEISSFSSNVDEATINVDGSIQEFLSYEGITDNLDEVLDLYYLTEENWRKIDALSKSVERELDDNKFIREIETMSSLLLFFGKSQEEALDIIVSERVIPYFVSESESLPKHLEWRRIIDEVFGVEGYPKSRKIAMILDADRKKGGVKNVN